MFGATINKLVVYAENLSGTRTPIDSLIGAQQLAQADPFALRSVLLSSLSAGVYKFVFQGHRGASSTGDISIDDVSVQQGPSCPNPSGLVATINVSCDSIELNWTSNSGSSILVYGLTGFNPATGGTAVNNITAPYSVNGLSANTAYDFYVADLCGSDTSNTISLTTSTASAPQPVASFTIDSAIVGGFYEIYLNGTGSSNATTYQWSFGNGSSSVAAVDTMIYSGNGNYTITLIVSNACGSDTTTFTTNVNIGLEDNFLSNSLNVYPNPAEHSFKLSFRAVASTDVQITLHDAQGRSVIDINDRIQSGNYSNDIDVSSLALGIYILEIKSGSLTAHRRISIK
jgi:PKD repeat protein